VYPIKKVFNFCFCFVIYLSYLVPPRSYHATTRAESPLLIVISIAVRSAHAAGDIGVTEAVHATTLSTRGLFSRRAVTETYTGLTARLLLKRWPCLAPRTRWVVLACESHRISAASTRHDLTLATLVAAPESLNFDCRDIHLAFLFLIAHEEDNIFGMAVSFQFCLVGVPDTVWISLKPPHLLSVITGLRDDCLLPRWQTPIQTQEPDLAIAQRGQRRPQLIRCLNRTDTREALHAESYRVFRHFLTAFPQGRRPSLNFTPRKKKVFSLVLGFCSFFFCFRGLFRGQDPQGT
jgi:hypothetical protein